jgi:hypothetical protein
MRVFGGTLGDKKSICFSNLLILQPLSVGSNPTLSASFSSIFQTVTS